jgi:hypothetical protein
MTHIDFRLYTKIVPHRTQYTLKKTYREEAFTQNSLYVNKTMLQRSMIYIRGSIPETMRYMLQKLCYREA